jgi:hypothetical protein
MSKQQFRVTNFRPDTRDVIDSVSTILAQYDGQKLSARQVYYRFLDAGMPQSWVDVEYNRKKGLPDDAKNTPKNYQRLISILTDARYAGLVDWDIIEDRGREPKVPSEWDSLDELVDAALEQFRLPRRSDQPRHLELWVEKDALAGVLGPIARRWHIPLVVNKGYSSASAMKVAADRMLAAVGATSVRTSCDACDTSVEDFNDGVCGVCKRRVSVSAMALDANGDTEFEKEVVVLYLGDHDPSGEDMVRDIETRLTEFGVPNLTIIKIALTLEQVRRYKLPSNPAKVRDARAKAYIEKFGNDSWEVDAIPPRELNQLVERSIARFTDRKLLDAVVAREDAERELVRTAIQRSRQP